MQLDLTGTAFTPNDDTLIPLDAQTFQQFLHDGKLTWEVSEGLSEYGLALAYNEDASDFFFEIEPVQDLDALRESACMAIPHPKGCSEILLVEPAPLRDTLRQHLLHVGASLRTTPLKRFSKATFSLGHPMTQEAKEAIAQTGSFYGHAGICSCGEPGCGSSFAWIENRVCVLVVETVGGTIRTVKLFPCQIKV